MSRAAAAGLLVLSLAIASSAADFSSNAVGTTAGEFLQLGVGARAMGLGGAYTAVADDATALYWNPAGLTQIQGGAATFMHAAYLASSFYDYGAYGQNLGDDGAFGAGVQYLNVGAITETDQNFNDIGTFTPNDLALSLGYAKAVDGYSIGLVGKYIQSMVLETAKTEAFDAGILSPAYFDGRFRLAAVADNVGGTLKYEQSSENLPLTFKVGGSYQVAGRWLACADAALPRDGAGYIALGTEYLFPVKSDWSFAGRLGYNSQTLGNITGVSGISIGVGFGGRSLAVDYAFVPYGGLGITNRVSLSFKFAGVRGHSQALVPALDTVAASPAPAAASSGLGHFEKADMLIQAGDYRMARAELEEESRTLNPSDGQMVRYYERLGRIELAENQESQAKADFIQAVKISKDLGLQDASSADAMAGMGLCLEQEGNAPYAMKFFQRALEIGPDPDVRQRAAGELGKISNSSP